MYIYTEIGREREKQLQRKGKCKTTAFPQLPTVIPTSQWHEDVSACGSFSGVRVTAIGTGNPHGGPLGSTL